MSFIGEGNGLDIPPSLDDTDLDIIAALHVAPRVPTAALAGILGIPSSTASRRIARLQRERIIRIVGRFSWNLITSSNPYELWITSFPGKSNEVTAALREIPDIQAIAQTNGARDIYANLYPLRGSSRDELLVERIPSIPGVRAIDSRLILETAKVGQSWRFARLPEEIMTALEQEAETDVLPPVEDLDDLSELEFQTMRLLGANGRISAAEAARQLGVSTSTAARAIRMLLQSGAVTCRVEIQPQLIGFSLWAFIALDVEPSKISLTLDSLAQHPAIRLLSTITGHASVSMSGSFEGPTELASFVRDDLGSLPGIRAVSTATALREVRRYWVDRDGLRLSGDVIDVLRR